MSFFTSMLGGAPKPQAVVTPSRIDADKDDARRQAEEDRRRRASSASGVRGSTRTGPAGAVASQASLLKPKLGAPA